MPETPDETPDNLVEADASAAEGGRGDERSEAGAAAGGGDPTGTELSLIHI